MKITKKTVKGKLIYEVTGYLGSYVDENGNKKQKNFHKKFSSSTEAKIAFEKAKSNFMKQRDLSSTGDFNNHPTFKAVYLPWREIYKEGVKESTLNRVDVLFEYHILPSFGDKLVDKITWQDCQRAVLEWKSQIKFFNKCVSYSSQIFKRAVKLGYIAQNPMELVDAPRVPNDILSSGKRNYWNVDQLKTFLTAVYRKDNGKRYDRLALFYLLATTGMRKGEALALTWEDVNVNQHSVSISKTITRKKNNTQTIGAPKTPSAYRTLFLDEATSNALHEYKKHLPVIPKNNDLIFQNQKGGIMGLMTPNHWLNYFIKATELPHITVHGLRHTFTSIQVQNATNVKAVQMQLGHSDAKITLNVYTHMERDQVAANIFDIGQII